ncbi:MAG: hypothetical protein ACPG77_10050, partial [Nannocystaceae bacterium]
MPKSDRSVSSQTMGTRVTASAFGCCVFERECGDEEPVRVGEAPEATIVVPSEIGAHSLLSAGQLHSGPFAGEIVGASGRRSVEAFAEPIALQPGDRVTLHLVDYPHVQVVLRREPSIAVNLRAPIGLRDLFPVLTYGLTAAMLLAAIATSVVWASDVQEIEVGNDIARAMYNFDPWGAEQEPELVDTLAGEAGVQFVFPEANTALLMGEEASQEVARIVGGKVERPAPEDAQAPAPSQEVAGIVGGEVERPVHKVAQVPAPVVEGTKRGNTGEHNVRDPAAFLLGDYKFLADELSDVEMAAVEKAAGV